MGSVKTPLVIVQYRPKGGTQADIREHTRFRPDSADSLVTCLLQCFSACADIDPEEIIVRHFRPTEEG